MKNIFFYNINLCFKIYSGEILSRRYQREWDFVVTLGISLFFYSFFYNLFLILVSPQRHRQMFQSKDLSK